MSMTWAMRVLDGHKITYRTVWDRAVVIGIIVKEDETGLYRDISSWTAPALLLWLGY